MSHSDRQLCISCVISKKRKKKNHTLSEVKVKERTDTQVLIRPKSADINVAPTAKPDKKQAIRSQCKGLALISAISLTFLEALHFGIVSRCWNWILNNKRLAERKKWKNWSVVSLGVGRSTFTLTNAWCHPFEQGGLKGSESEEVGNLWMMTTVILLDTTVCHFSLLIFPVLYVCERGSVCNL